MAGAGMMGGLRLLRRRRSQMSKFSEMPYSRCFVPQKDGFAAYIREFPGCLSQGRTLAGAYKNLEKVADSWVEAALSQGQTIPPPLEHSWPKDQEGEFVKVRREDLATLWGYWHRKKGSMVMQEIGAADRIKAVLAGDSIKEAT